jgi:capsular exopolysaccharide synthesis family protein
MKKHESEQPAGPPPIRSASAAASAAPAAMPAAAPPAEAKGRTMIGPVCLNGYSPTLVTHHDRGGRITEQYRALRTNLLAQYADERFCILVTSAEPGEGKTVTTLNLCLVLAERQERRTIVIDCDLRKRRVAGLLNINNVPGVADVLRGTARVDDVTHTTPYGNLFVIPAGQAKQNEVGELLHRPELEEAMNELRRKYDYVLLDTPPISIASDAGIVGRATREAILVVRMNKTHRESVERAIRLLHAANVKPVGVVLTHQRYYIPNYLYRYS